MGQLPALDPWEVVVLHHEMDAVVSAGNEPDENLVLLQLLLILGVPHGQSGPGVLPALQIEGFRFLLKLGANNRKVIRLGVGLEGADEVLVAFG